MILSEADSRQQRSCVYVLNIINSVNIRNVLQLIYSQQITLCCSIFVCSICTSIVRTQIYVSTHSTKSRHNLTRSIQWFPARAEFQYFSATCWHHSFMRTSEWGAASRYSRLAIGRAHAAQRSRLRPASDSEPLPAKLPVAQPHQLTSNKLVRHLFIHFNCLDLQSVSFTIYSRRSRLIDDGSFANWR